MFRSPTQLRSGSKGQRVPLSGTDKSKTARSLSVSSIEDTTTTVMAESAGSVSKVIDPTIIADIVNKHLASGVVVDRIIEKLTADLKTVVEEAVRSALSDVNREVSRLSAEVAKLSAVVGELDGKLVERTDELEQYQRRNNIRIFGIKETAGEDTDRIVVDLCREKLGLQGVSLEALSRTHRVGRTPKPGPNGEQRHRPIIVRFTSYRDRRVVVDSKKRLKGTGIVIREDLTTLRLELLRKVTAVYGVRSTWSQDGRIMWIDKDGVRGTATRLGDLPLPPPVK